jgi:serine/threonine protein kinase
METSNELELPSSSNRKDKLVVNVEKIIGSGAFGTVYKIKYKGQDAALKIVKNNNPDSVDIIDEEVRILRGISEKYPNCSVDDNILCYYDISKDDNNIYFVSELLDIDYFDAIANDNYCNSSNGTKIDFVYDSLKQMLNGLRTLHNIGIIHRDIKPENFLVKWTDPKIIKIADFGFSCYYLNKKNGCQGRKGSPSYVAPHIFLDENEPIWSVMDDLYSLACVVYSGLTCDAFMSDDNIRKIINEFYTRKINKKKLEDFYIDNYNYKFNILYKKYTLENLTKLQDKKYGFLREICAILLNPIYIEKMYTADEILNSLTIK